MDRVTISIVTAVGAFSVSLLSIFLGFELFLIGAQGGFKFSASSTGASVGLESIAPGLAFAAFGMIVAVWALHKLIGRS